MMSGLRIYAGGGDSGAATSRAGGNGLVHDRTGRRVIRARGAVRSGVAAALALMLTLMALPAVALPPLAQERYINDRLVAARVADVLRRGCPSIDARMIKAFSEARALKRYALDKGYSAAAIDAFLDDRTQRQRIYREADRYMVANGVVSGDPETFCRLGRDEIARKTIAGSLLVAR